MMELRGNGAKVMRRINKAAERGESVEAHYGQLARLLASGLSPSVAWEHMSPSARAALDAQLRDGAIVRNARNEESSGIEQSAPHMRYLEAITEDIIHRAAKVSFDHRLDGVFVSGQRQTAAPTSRNLATRLRGESPSARAASLLRCAAGSTASLDVVRYRGDWDAFTAGSTQQGDVICRIMAEHGLDVAQADTDNTASIRFFSGSEVALVRLQTPLFVGLQSDLVLTKCATKRNTGPTHCPAYRRIDVEIADFLALDCAAAREFGVEIRASKEFTPFDNDIRELVGSALEAREPALLVPVANQLLMTQQIACQLTVDSHNRALVSVV